MPKTKMFDPEKPIKPHKLYESNGIDGRGWQDTYNSAMDVATQRIKEDLKNA